MVAPVASESTSVSANTVDLGTFVDNGQGFTGALRGILIELERRRLTIGTAVGSTPDVNGLEPLRELLAEAMFNNKFVEVIREELRTFQAALPPGLHSGQPVVTAPASRMDGILVEAGFQTDGTDRSLAEDEASVAMEQCIARSEMLVAELEAVENRLAELSHYNLDSGPDEHADLEQRLADLQQLVLAHVDYLNHEIAQGRAVDADPTERVRLRGLLVRNLADNEALAAAAIDLLDDGLPVRTAFVEAEALVNHKARIDAVMAERRIGRAEAEAIVAEVDRITITLVTAGHGVEAAAIAAVIAEANDLNIEEIIEFTTAFQSNAADAAALAVQARRLDMTPEQLGTYLGLQTYFAEIARDGKEPEESVVTWDDVEYVASNPSEFSTHAHTIATMMLEDPSIFHRLDDAVANTDILDADSFGSTTPEDGKIGFQEFPAFEFKQTANDLLYSYSAQIDTINGGDRDYYFSQGDYRAFLENLPSELEATEADAILHQIIDGKMYDKSWVEANWDEIVIVVAIVAGVAVSAVTGGTLAPLAAGFIAGAVAAGGAQVAGNLAFGNDWNEGLGGAMLRGGFGGLGGAALPMSIGGLSGGTAFSNTVARLGLASDVTGLVALGGTDILLPEDWESPVQTGAEFVSLTAGVGALTTVGGRLVVRRVGPGSSPLTPGSSILTVLGNGTHFQSPNGLIYGPGSQHGTRIAHLEAHMINNPARVTNNGNPAPHGVFSTDNAFQTVDDAWLRVQAGHPGVVTIGTAKPGANTVHIVPMDETIGYLGGPAGLDQFNPTTQWVHLVVNGDELITAYPVTPQTVIDLTVTPKPDTVFGHESLAIAYGDVATIELAEHAEVIGVIQSGSGITSSGVSEVEDPVVTGVEHHGE